MGLPRQSSVYWLLTITAILHTSSFGQTLLLQTDVAVDGNPPGLNTPIDVALSPDGRHLYTASLEDDAIAIFAPDPVAGTLNFVGLAQNLVDGVTGLDGAFSVAVAPNGNHVYAISEFNAAVVSFSRNLNTGLLTQIDLEVPADGIPSLVFPRAIAIAPDGKHVYVTSDRLEDNTPLGFINILARDISSGELTFVDSITQEDQGIAALQLPSIPSLSPDGLFLYAPDAIADALYTFSRDLDTGLLTLVDTLIENQDGVIGIFQITVLDVSPDGRHAYGSGNTVKPGSNGNLRGSLPIFDRSMETGKLTMKDILFDGDEGIDGLSRVNEVSVSPDGTLVYVASQNDNSVSVFRRDVDTGLLQFGETQRDGLDGVTGLRGATDLAVSPTGLNVYLSSEFDNAISMFAKDIVGFLSGVIISETSGTGLACAAIEFTHREEPIIRSAVTDATGFYFVDDLPIGEYGVRIYGIGHGETSQDPIIILEDDVLEQNYSVVPLDMANGVAGIVFDFESNEPLVATRVTARIDGEIVAETLSCGNGEFELTGITSKGDTTVNLSYESMNYQGGTADVIVPSGQVAQADQSLEKAVAFAASMTGRITAESHMEAVSTIEGARVTIRGPFNASVFTMADGNYAFDSVLGGNYTIRASAEGYISEESAWTVASDGVAFRNLVLTPKSTTVPTDINADGTINAIDVQLVINAVLGFFGGGDPDVNQDGTSNAIDIQMVINSVLGI